MAHFFIAHLDVVFFVYGMAFFIMGTAILTQPKERSEFRLADILWLLAVFCFLHGLNEFLDMWSLAQSSGKILDLIRLCALTISYMFFFEFGRRLFRMTVSSTKSYYRKLSEFFTFWFSPLIGSIIALRIILYPHDLNSEAIIARYFLGVPAGILTGLGFILYCNFNLRSIDNIKIRQSFLTAGIAFLIYGVLGGLIVPKGNLFFSSWLNTDSFLAWFKFPIQLLRAICASAAAWGVCSILRIFSWEKEEFIKSNASALEIVNRQLHSEIAHRIKLEEELRTLSITDSLTGLYNYRGFLALGQQQMKIAKRNKQDVLLIFADLDNLKWINDTLGHKEGDVGIIEVAKIIKSNFRESDIIARIGVDEFVILAIQAEKESASKLIAKLQNKLSEYNSGSSRSYHLSLSAGMAYCDAKDPCSIDELLSRADKLMYEQKKAKNRI
jgi:diguanylate cyclase (GGDEF)-like protein